ncbi:hypothetical protein P389DRAFT_213239 [Cystobasidium minutum MCA 4210]|uniref:uncharacterized protein n=1 Tax=Cystobasidium minutum MCA 4210 TaxID=1397322 RepID=UPI0034CE7677|eukprot:jgi/Rhomi1/213239/estExt_Genemark1.C_100026
MDGQSQRLLRLHPLVSTVSDDFLDVTFDGMITSRLHPFTTLFITFIAFTLLLQVQPTYGKKEETASLGGEFDKLSKGCQSYLKVMMTPANLIGSCTQLADLVMDLASDGSESETSVLEPVSEWETQFCSTAGCTKGAIKQGKKALSANCAKEIKAGEMIPSIAMTMLDNYSLVRSLACTAAAQNKKGDYCFRGVLADLETASYQTNEQVLSPRVLSQILAHPLLFLQSLDGTAWCSRCLNYLSLKAGPIMEDISSGSSEGFYDVLKQTCKIEAKTTSTEYQVTMKHSVSLFALATCSLGLVSAGAGPSKEAQKQYARQWQALSKKCQASLMTIVDSKSEISKCSSAGKLFNSVVSNSAVDHATSLVPLLQDWLEDDFCDSAPCKSDVVTAALQNVAKDCSAEIEKQMWVPVIAHTTLLSYESGRTAICLKDTGAKDNSTSYCPAEVLHNIESSGTPITYEQGQVALKNPMKQVNSVPTWTYCTPCTQGMLAPVMNAINLLNPEWATSVKNAVDGKCGAGFTVTSTPESLEDGITYGNSTGGSGSSSGGNSGSGDEFDEDEGAGFKQQSLATSAAILLSLAFVAVVAL